MIRMLLILALLMNLAAGSATAASKARILFIPHDDRPVSLQYTADTITAAGFTLITPPKELLGSRGTPGNADKLWGWLFENLSGADAAVLSGDMLLYGGLVESRRHMLPEATVQERLANVSRIKEQHPGTKLYIFTSIMRSPKFSAGGVEPDYYEQYGGSIFRLTALEDKKETEGLTRQEEKERQSLTAAVPTAVISDWMERRQINLKANMALLKLAGQSIDTLVLGRDDNAPFSQTRRENRLLLKEAAALSPAAFQSIPGVDELAMVLLTRAANDLTYQIPIVAVRYAPGKGPETVPSYSDEPIGKSVHSHLYAAGMIPLPSPLNPDFTLLVNTDAGGITREAGSPLNLPVATPAAKALVDEAQTLLQQGRKVVIADSAYANGADNGLMQELKQRSLLPQLTAYSGWNTPNNTVGFAIGQGLFGLSMEEKDRRKLLAVRLLDDWGYQANIRQQLANEVLVPNGGNYFYLNNLRPLMTETAQVKMNHFAKEELADFNISQLKVDFSWNRMFELYVEPTMEH